MQAKKVYNNHGKQRGLLSGDVWFEQQAFRCCPACSGGPVTSRLRIDSKICFISSFTIPCVTNRLKRQGLRVISTHAASPGKGHTARSVRSLAGPALD